MSTRLFTYGSIQVDDSIDSERTNTNSIPDLTKST